MNASSSSISGPCSTSAWIRSMAWLVFSPARVSSRKAVCKRFDRLARKVAPLKADPVRAEHPDLALADDARKRHHILRDHAVSADESIRGPPGRTDARR